MTHRNQFVVNYEGAEFEYSGPGFGYELVNNCEDKEDDELLDEEDDDEEEGEVEVYYEEHELPLVAPTLNFAGSASRRLVESLGVQPQQVLPRSNWRSLGTPERLSVIANSYHFGVYEDESPLVAPTLNFAEAASQRLVNGRGVAHQFDDDAPLIPPTLF